MESKLKKQNEISNNIKSIFRSFETLEKSIGTKKVFFKLVQKEEV